ncbi:MAG: DEAD/DEAH box helicase [Afipia sp.]|nr:DEAD/DEAH box helicase [Afipia sp.]
MSYSFKYLVGPEATEIEISGPSGSVPMDLWSVEAPASLLKGVDLAQRLIAAGAAIAAESTLLVEHRAIAGLSISEAKAFGLPILTDVVLHLDTAGAFNRPEFRVRLSWRRLTGQPVVGALRTGAWLKIGEEWHRLPDAVFEIAEAVDELNAASVDDLAGRLTSMAALREVLPPAVTSGLAETDGLLGEMTIAVADAFSLDLKGDGRDAKLVPILHRAGGHPDDLLLAPDEQAAFGDDLFNRFGDSRPVYALGAGKYVVLSPAVRRALSEVRRVQSSPTAAKRALIANPRAFFRDALGSDADETVLESVFRETSNYADRVIGLGLWQPRVLPWIKLGTTNWFGPEGLIGDSSNQRVGIAEAAGILVGEETIPLSPEEADALRARVEDAIGAGRRDVPLKVGEKTVSIPASHETLAAIQSLENARAPRNRDDHQRAPTEQERLIIVDNENEVEAEALVSGRDSPPLMQPACLVTKLKQHQVEGLEWLQKAWRMGRPGVLLADDMGLGKTIQGLAFFAWLREGMAAKFIERAPLLIVAPTGLLENWRAEHERHLSKPGLGQCVQAYGKGLSEARYNSIDGRPSINLDRLRDADWVLTTYETLRDYDRDFGQVRFAAILFDEAQKIKTPGVRITDAAKAMNGDFRVALTGTPVENRLADLWCITDAVHPACLGDLKSFSFSYEREPSFERLQLLKSSLDSWHGKRPPLLLRRLKEDQLPDLPRPVQRVHKLAMFGDQLAAYEAAIESARRINKPGKVLEVLQFLRSVSLHHSSNAQTPDAEFIQASARMRLAFNALDGIAERRERALIFLDDLHMQARLVGVIQRRYSLRAPPMVINGGVSGLARQARVDRFQVGPEEFDVMILSPRAGGVGLTLTHANHVIHLSRWWNPAVEDQCTGRVLRIGQMREVQVHIPIALLPSDRPSFDQNLHELLERKRRLMRDALMPPNATEEDRNDLFESTINP